MHEEQAYKCALLVVPALSLHQTRPSNRRTCSRYFSPSVEGVLLAFRNTRSRSSLIPNTQTTIYAIPIQDRRSVITTIPESCFSMGPGSPQIKEPCHVPPKSSRLLRGLWKKTPPVISAVGKQNSILGIFWACPCTDFDSLACSSAGGWKRDRTSFDDLDGFGLCVSSNSHIDAVSVVLCNGRSETCLELASLRVGKPMCRHMPFLPPILLSTHTFG